MNQTQPLNNSFGEPCLESDSELSELNERNAYDAGYKDGQRASAEEVMKLRQLLKAVAWLAAGG